MRRRNAAAIGAVLILCSLGAPSASWAQPANLAGLVQRFRPYYKFSTEALGRGQEPMRPCTWEWFAKHSELKLGSRVYVPKARLARDPRLIIQQANSDVRSSRDPDHRFSLSPSVTAREGQPWSAVINDAAGLYGQAENIGDGLVLIVYWTLYAYNLGTGGVAFEHEGDITAVAVVYDAARDALIRASFVIHGAVLESFDLQRPESRTSSVLRGVAPDGAGVAVEAEVLRIPPERRYQDGPSWHSPARPSDIYLVHDPSSGRFEHLALFVEWGAHEPWPNPNGGVIAAPRHGGDGVSFLPARVRFVGTAAAPVESEAPFLFFNGVWGDPPSPVFHRTFHDARAPNGPPFGIPDDRRLDREPYAAGGLSWPPARDTGPSQARIRASCTGDRDGAQVAIRWGHPDFDESEYFPLWTIRRGQSLERAFSLPDQHSELEVQTEGGEASGYTISIWVEGASGPQAEPSIVLTHNMGGVRDSHVVANTVRATRSSSLNRYGEQNIRVDTSSSMNGPIR